MSVQKPVPSMLKHVLLPGELAFQLKYVIAAPDCGPDANIQTPPVLLPPIHTLLPPTRPFTNAFSAALLIVTTCPETPRNEGSNSAAVSAPCHDTGPATTK